MIVEGSASILNTFGIIVLLDTAIFFGGGVSLFSLNQGNVLQDISSI